MEKLLFYDLETTGVKHWRNGIHQISGIVVIGGEEKERFNFKVKPNEKAEIDKAALDVCGITEDDLKTYMDMRECYGKLLGVLTKYVDKFNKSDKFHLVGYNNAGFDDKFLRAFFTQLGDSYFGSWFWADSIDCMVLASYALRSERAKLANFQLATVAKYLGVEVDTTKTHDALYDVQLTRAIYNNIELI